MQPLSTKSEERYKMSNELKLKSKVVCPVTDEDGETSFEIGTLVSLNSRYAGVDVGGKVIKIGKTKIEPLTQEEEEEHPEPSKGRDLSNFQSCRSASGRKSLDNGDEVALQLRGQPLEVAYKIAAKKLKVTQASLKAAYGHLNPGQQRMILGNRVRAAK